MKIVTDGEIKFDVTKRNNEKTYVQKLCKQAHFLFRVGLPCFFFRFH